MSNGTPIFLILVGIVLILFATSRRGRETFDVLTGRKVAVDGAAYRPPKANGGATR